MLCAPQSPGRQLMRFVWNLARVVATQLARMRTEESQKQPERERERERDSRERQPKSVERLGRNCMSKSVGIERVRGGKALETKSPRSRKIVAEYWINLCDEVQYCRL